MCQDYGCSDVSAVAINGEVQHLHPRPHPRFHSHEPGTHSHGYRTHSHERGAHSHDSHVHSHDLGLSHVIHSHEPNGNGAAALRTVAIHTALLTKNDRFAERNRGYFQAKRLLVFNLLSSPGSGKTALLERMIRDLGDRSSEQRSLKMGVIVGDLETDNDAQRLRQAGAPAIQITTGHACHLEAEMVARAMSQLDLDALDLLVIENVGNLVCPAAYDLGETLRVVLLSVTEGEDKPLKYPTMFKTADVILLTKIDIADAVGFNRELAIANIQRVAPQAQIFEISARRGDNLDAWYHYLAQIWQTAFDQDLCTSCGVLKALDDVARAAPAQHHPTA
jgi:hydrogenase nickel incorporation protein HypB